MKWSWLIILVFWSPILGQELTYQSSSKLPQPLEESSGLVIASDTSFYTINDSGNDPILFEINHSGKIIRKIQIKGQNKDWEELAKDEKGNIYIGDFGNNLNSRKDLKIYKLNHSDLHLNEIKPTVYSFAYPDQKQFPPEKYELHFDCEAFVIHEGKAYLFTKNRTEPFDGISNVYQVNLESSKTEIKKIGEIQLCKDGWYPCSVTSASYENGQLLLLTYAKIVRFTSFDFEHPEENPFDYIPLLKIEQFEAITQTKNGTLFLTSEKQKIIGGNNLYKAVIK